jgi:hypothetical protein
MLMEGLKAADQPEYDRRIFTEPRDITVGFKSIWGVYGYVYGGNDIVSSHFEGLDHFLDIILDNGLARQRPNTVRPDVFAIFDTDEEVKKIIQANKNAKDLLIASLRQELLFVDHIYVPDAEYSQLLNLGIEGLSALYDEEVIKLASLGDISQSVSSLNDGILTITSTFSKDGYELNKAVQDAYAEMMDYMYCLIMLLRGANEENIGTEYRNEEKKVIFRKMKTWGIARSVREYLTVGSLMHDLQTRYWCQLASDRYGVTPIPLVSTFAHYDKLPNVAMGKQVEYQDVVRAVLKRIPIPSPLIPLDEFIDIRRSVEHKNCFNALKRWMRKIGKGDVTFIELEEELEYLLSEYESFMNLQRLSIETGVFQTVITTGGDVIENLLKFNLGKAAKSAFELQRRKIALMEAERKAPGREVSYIVNSRMQLIRDL